MLICRKPGLGISVLISIIRAAGEEAGGMEEVAGAVVEEVAAAGVEVVAVGGGFHGLDAAATRPKTSSKTLSSKTPSSKAKAALGLMW